MDRPILSFGAGWTDREKVEIAAWYLADAKIRGQPEPILPDYDPDVFPRYPSGFDDAVDDCIGFPVATLAASYPPLWTDDQRERFWAHWRKCDQAAALRAHCPELVDDPCLNFANPLWKQK